MNHSKNQFGNQPFETYRKSGFWKQYWVEIAIVLFGLLAINLVFIARELFSKDIIDLGTAGPMGDFIGGYFGTVLGLVSVLLIYSAFKDQRLSSTTEKFQNKYFELIKIHRENVAEIKIGRAFNMSQLADFCMCLVRRLPVATFHGCSTLDTEFRRHRKIFPA